MKRLFGVLLVVAVTLVVLAGSGCKERREAQPGGMGALSGGNMGAPIPSDLEINELRRAAETAPKSAGAWIRLGNALMDAQQYPEAIKAYGKGLALAPKDVRARTDRGTCLRRAGKPKEAAAEFRKAIAVDPTFATAHRNLGVVLTYDLHDTVAGVKEFKRYLELEPDAPDAAAMRATIDRFSGTKGSAQP